MLIPSLKALSVKKVSSQINLGHISLSHRLPEDASNQLFDVHGSDLRNINPSKLDVTRAKLDNCSRRDYENLTNFHLEFLSIGRNFNNDLDEWLKEKQMKEGKTYIDCLIECMAPSCLSLESLRTGMKEYKDVNWLIKILDYFVNLHQLDFSVVNWSRPREFPHLNKTYSKVDCLNISNTAIRSLNGVSKFPNLNVLVMRNLHFQSADDIAELFSLQNLKFLDVSHEFVIDGFQDPFDDVVRVPNTQLALQLIQYGRSFPTLEEIDCSNIIIDTTTLKAFLALNPTIKKIALLNTQVEKLRWDNVEVISTNDLEDALKALEWYRKNDHNNFTRVILEAVLAHLNKKLDFGSNEATLRKCLDALLNIVEDFADNCWSNGENTCVVKSVILFCDLYLKHLSPEKIKHMISVMMNNAHTNFLAYSILANPDIVKTPGLDICWLYQKVVKFFPREFTNVTEHTRNMVRALKNVHELTTREIRDKTRGKARCIVGVYNVLHIIGAREGLDEDEDLPFCIFIAKLNKKMISSLDVALHWHLALYMINCVNECPHPKIKLLFLNACRFVIYRMNSEDIPKLAERVDLKMIMECLLGDLRSPDSNTGEYLDRKLAFSALQTLAVFYETSQSEDFKRQLREVTENHQYSNFHVPRIIIDQKTGKKTFVTYDEKHLERWLVSTELVTRTLKDDLARVNKNKYEPRQRRATERMTIRFEYLDDPSIDEYFPIVFVQG